jgi:NADPH:quinone reductase-like Zn-dependent oxidoreductase
MSVLVIGAAGAVGKRLIGALASRGRAPGQVWRDEDDLRCLKRVGKPRKKTYIFLPSTCGVEKNIKHLCNCCFIQEASNDFMGRYILNQEV